ncbi:cytochrome P450 [Phytomonospora sp. NPDC050363]|uniref:cytochrome P450 n=1 Tax=Phytomonospora sp. NPDC050363 TaxID=3155642 RepID=UPI0033F3DEDE
MNVEVCQEIPPDRVFLRGRRMAEDFFRASDEQLSHAGGWDLVFGDRFGRGVLNVDGARHRELRKALMPVLTKRAADDYRALVREVFGRALALVEPDRPIDVHALTRKAVFEVSAALFAGIHAAEAMDLLAAYTDLQDPGAPLGDPNGDRVARRIVKARRRMRETLMRAVDRMGAEDGPVRRLRELPDGPADAAIAENLGIVILAGFDTTSFVTARLLWLLAHHPGHQDAIREDATEALLESAFVETMRLHPPLAWLPRRAETDLRFGETLIPAGSAVFYAVAESHRDPELFDAPHEFRPERHRAAEPDRFALTPFSAGRRLCPGVHVATMEVKLITTMVLRRFRLSAEPGDHVGDVSHNGSTVTPAAELLVRFHELS